MSGAYYNEHDPFAAQWLRNLISRGLIAPGEVDERSIVDVRPDELRSYTQCHFFAGVGVWSYALRRAGWPDDRPVWTGSCPCQPFSAAGKGGGFADERHLWPAWHWLIEQCRPIRVFGEQVASKDGLAWLDLVHADLEGTGYAMRTVDLCAAGFGAPHIRQRLFFVASLDNAADARQHNARQYGSGSSLQSARPVEPVASGFVADAQCGAAERHRHAMEAAPRGSESEVRPRPQRVRDDAGDGVNAGRMADADGRFAGDRQLQHGGQFGFHLVRPSPTNGFWRNADWIGCTDGKWRPIEPGTFPLVDGSAFRMGSGRADLEGKSRAKMLRGYGNAIVAEVAAKFIEAVM